MPRWSCGGKHTENIYTAYSTLDGSQEQLGINHMGNMI